VDGVAAIGEEEADFRADESGGAGDEDGFHGGSRFLKMIREATLGTCSQFTSGYKSSINQHNRWRAFDQHAGTLAEPHRRRDSGGYSRLFARRTCSIGFQSAS
jgi:hypothetical protein